MWLQKRKNAIFLGIRTKFRDTHTHTHILIIVSYRWKYPSVIKYVKVYDLRIQCEYGHAAATISSVA